jgi:hypothetical protein
VKWDAEGDGLWLLVNRTTESPATFVLMHAESADGSQTTFNGSSMFAGWATAQPAYPVP